MTAQNPFNRIVYFGDSLTDGGTIFDLTSEVLAIPVPPAQVGPVGYDGKFSNGDIYADILPRLLGAGVENFGVGGARAIGEIPLGALFPGNQQAPENFNPFIATPSDELINFDINLGGQIDRFVASEIQRGTPIPGTAASFLIGLNDFNNFTPSSTDPDVATAEAIQLAAQIQVATLEAVFTVVGAGVETVILNTLPGASFFPSSAFLPPEVLALGEAIIPLYNFNLTVTAQVLQGAGIDARLVDMAAIADEIVDDPTAFGFVAPFDDSIFLGFGSDPVIVDDGFGNFVPFFPSNTDLTIDSQVTIDPDIDDDQIAFIDLLHPTTATHGILAAFSELSLTGDDILFGEEGNDTQLGGGGDDGLFGGLGNDRLIAGRGDDVVLGGQGDDLLTGFLGHDILNGGSGNDRVIGGRGADVLAGGAGDDVVAGGAGGDILIGGLGDDLLAGGLGNDRFFYTEAALLGQEGNDSDRIVGGQGRDTVFLALTDETRALVEADLSNARNQVLEDIGLQLVSIERVVFVDRLDFAGLNFINNEEADLWGLV